MFAQLRAAYWRHRYNQVRKLRGQLVLRNFRLADTAEHLEAKAIAAENTVQGELAVNEGRLLLVGTSAAFSLGLAWVAVSQHSLLAAFYAFALAAIAYCFIPHEDTDRG